MQILHCPASNRFVSRQQHVAVRIPYQSFNHAYNQLPGLLTRNGAGLGFGSDQHAAFGHASWNNDPRGSSPLKRRSAGPLQAFGRPLSNGCKSEEPRQVTGGAANVAQLPWSHEALKALHNAHNSCGEVLGVQQLLQGIVDEQAEKHHSARASKYNVTCGAFHTLQVAQWLSASSGKLIDKLTDIGVWMHWRALRIGAVLECPFPVFTPCCHAVDVDLVPQDVPMRHLFSCMPVVQ